MPPFEDSEVESQVADTSVEQVESQEASDDGPSSMLEALQAGLKTDTTDDATAEADRFARDEAGRFAKKEAEKAAAEAAQAADDPAAKAAAEAAKKVEDDDLSMPEGISPKAQERFKKLAGRLSETSHRAQELERDLSGIQTILKESGGTPQEFSTAFDYIRRVKSGDLEGALQVLDTQRQQIALALGKPLPGADPLAQFPDLRQRVDGFHLDEQSALEIARSRMQQGHQQRAQQDYYAQERQTQQAHAVRSSAVQEVDRLGSEWARTDPDYAAKESIIAKQIPLIAQRFPPEQWPNQVRLVYQTLSAMPSPQRQITPPALRSSGQSAGVRQPSNMLEALQNGLGYAR